MANVTVTLTGDEQKLLKALDRVVQKEREMALAGAKAGEDTARGGEKANGVLGKLTQTIDGAFGQGAAGKIVSFAGKLGLITSAAGVVMAAVAQVKREMQAVIDLQKNMVEPQLTLSSARRDLIRNMPGSTQAQVDAMLTSAGEISKQTKVDEKYISRALADALSASSGDAEASKKAVSVAARYLADKPEMISAYAGSLLDVSSITGTKDAMANMGYLGFVGGRARVVDPAMQGKNIPRALEGVIGMGGTSQEAAALYAAMTAGAKDVTGESSGTAVISLAQQLRDYKAKPLGDAEILKTLVSESPAAERGKIREYIDLYRRQQLTDSEILSKLGDDGYGDQISRLRVRKTTGLPEGLSTGQAIGAMQANPELARSFLATSTFEKKFLGPIEQLLLNPQSEIAKAYRENLAVMPRELSSLTRVGESVLKNFSVDPLGGTFEVNQAFKSAINQQLTKNPSLGLSGVLRERLPEMLKSIGEGDLATKLSGLEFEARSDLGRSDAGQAAIRMLEGRAKELKNPWKDTFWSGLFAAFSNRPDSGMEKKSESEMASDTKTAAAIMELAAAIRENLAAQAVTNQELGRRDPTLGNRGFVGAGGDR
jgi:hypothetical protein